MKRSQAGVSVSLAFAAVALIAVALGCKDSNTITEPPHTPVPATPTPTPASSIEGAWSGTWDAREDTSRCKAIPATAHFSADGTGLTGSLSSPGAHKYSPLGSPCWGGSLRFYRGSLRGRFLSGLITNPDETILGSAQGTLSDSGTTLEIVLDYHLTGYLKPVFMHLHR